MVFEDSDCCLEAEWTWYPGIDRPHMIRRYGDNASTYYYGRDELGSVTELINVGGGVANRYRYTPWGEAAAGTSESVYNPFRFAGATLDASTGLYFMWANDSDPKRARFMSEEPPETGRAPVPVSRALSKVAGSRLQVLGSSRIVSPPTVHLWLRLRSASDRLPAVPCSLFPVTCGFAFAQPATFCRLFPVPCSCSLFPVPCSLFPVPCSLFPVPCSLFPVPCSLFPVPCSLFLFPVPCSLFPVPCSLFPVPCSLFPVPCSLFPVPCSLFPVPCSLFPVPCSLFPVPCSLFPVTCHLSVTIPPSAAAAARGREADIRAPRRRSRPSGC